MTGPFTAWALVEPSGEGAVDIPIRALRPRPRSELAWIWWLRRQRERRRLTPPQRVARDLHRYLAAPRDQATTAELLDSVSMLLEHLLEDGPDLGDDLHCWLDGIRSGSMEATGPDSAVITGHAWVGERQGGSFRLRPIHAELRRPPSICRLYMASLEYEFAYDVSVLEEATGAGWPSRITDRLIAPPDPQTWPHAHAIVLRPVPRPRRGPWWWTGDTRASSAAGPRLRGRLRP